MRRFGLLVLAAFGVLSACGSPNTNVSNLAAAVTGRCSSDVINYQTGHNLVVALPGSSAATEVLEMRIDGVELDVAGATTRAGDLRVDASELWGVVADEREGYGVVEVRLRDEAAGTQVEICQPYVPGVLAEPAGRVAPVRVPIVFCVVEGTEFAREGVKGIAPMPASTVAAASGARDIWEQAQIEMTAWQFSTGVTNQAFGRPVVPLLQHDPSFGQPVGQVDVLPRSEAQSLMDDCSREWADLDIRGIPVVIVNSFRGGAAGAIAFTTGLPLNAATGGARYEDFCDSPRQLRPSDLDARGIVMLESALQRSDRGNTLAHELGHVLMLGHGNGVDDNVDGTQPPGDGPRRFDRPCDALLEAEDDLPIDPSAERPPCGSRSLMTSGEHPCTELSDLQIEHARASAMVSPGASDS